MKITGIIVEHNPFHNGHKYHIEETIRLTKPDILVAIMTGNYNQRGDLSIIDKFEKTKIALDNGIDLIIELPYVYTMQNAYIYGSKAIKLLNEINCNYLVFGSESNNLEELKQYASLEIDVTRLKELLRQGNSFPKAYGLLAGALYPNDILAVAYLKEIQNTNIIPISIQRTSNYKEDKISIDTSASAIRKAILNNEDYHEATNIKIDNPVFLKDLYPFIQNKLFTLNKEELKKIFMVDEGIENLLIKNAYKYFDFEDFINNTISRRYTRSKIQRTLIHIINNITKDDINNLKEDNYLRILGFNNKGRKLLNKLKEDENKKIITQFKNIPSPYKEIEWKINLVYASLLKDPEAYLKKELKGPIII